ncbi:MAG: hypothetical protein DMG42_02025 [Acidobacteria bacterium]|nr:MAG: hypothetical protein DMG42_02025 [Acidobacteriota bacterium]
MGNRPPQFQLHSASLASEEGELLQDGFESERDKDQTNSELRTRASRTPDLRPMRRNSCTRLRAVTIPNHQPGFPTDT